MARNKFILVSDDSEMVRNVENFCFSLGETVKVYTQQEWESMVANPSTMSQQFDEPLPGGLKEWDQGAKILPFPSPSSTVSKERSPADRNGKVLTMNEMESEAIRKAIYEFGGNLTEAAKALGIGRATLYRKVKQYNIDPTAARRNKAA